MDKIPELLCTHAGSSNGYTCTVGKAYPIVRETTAYAYVQTDNGQLLRVSKRTKRATSGEGPDFTYGIIPSHAPLFTFPHVENT